MGSVDDFVEYTRKMNEYAVLAAVLPAVLPAVVHAASLPAAVLAAVLPAYASVNKKKEDGEKNGVDMSELGVPMKLVALPAAVLTAFSVRLY